MIKSSFVAICGLALLFGPTVTLAAEAPPVGGTPALQTAGR